LSADDYRSTITSTIQSDKSSAAEVYYAVRASINFGLAVDEAAIEKRLKTLAKTDDSVLAQGYALLTGAQLSQPIAKYYADTINDLVQQADEFDGRSLQYEGGVGTTALIFNAFYEVAEKAGATMKIDPKQLVKFAYYFSTKRHVATLRSAYYLTKAFKHLSNNKVERTGIRTIELNLSGLEFRARRCDTYESHHDHATESNGARVHQQLARSTRRRTNGHC
jgi:oligosaccharyltransferase complex subunit delta (ribophorin II)